LEYEQERIAYQKLLKDFNRMEAVAENLRDEVDILKDGGHNRTFSLTVLAEGAPQDVGLMMKLQGALKGAHREKDRLECRLEEAEGQGATRDLLKLQEFEVENSAVRGDLAQLREAVASGGEGGQAARELQDQFESLQEELDRRPERGTGPCVKRSTASRLVAAMLKLVKVLAPSNSYPEGNYTFCSPGLGRPSI
jgi:hypothetical protein